MTDCFSRSTDTFILYRGRPNCEMSVNTTAVNYTTLHDCFKIPTLFTAEDQWLGGA